MWQKESTNKSALYINLCVEKSKGNLDDIYQDLRAEINAHKKMKSLYAKCDEVSRKKRQKAKAYFDERNWEDAIDWYNEALCFAEKESKSVGLTFAYRSACFFNMRLYDRCLIDIQKAIENNCPKRLVPELKKRKLSCQKYITNGMQSEQRTMQLDFMEDGRFPGMANVVEITKSADNKHAIIARQNIDVGQIVAIDKGFTKTLFTIYGWKCVICLKSKTNLVPCKRCTTAMFCHDCDFNLHKYECGMKTSLYSNFNNHLMQELRTFFVAMNLFADATEMMEFVEQSIGSDQFEIPNTLRDDRSKYRAFLKLAKNTAESKDVQFPQIVFGVYKILLEIPKVQTMFTSKRHRRFLMHLVGHHVEINIRQAYVAVEDMEDGNKKVEKRTLYSQVGVMLGYFHHSCSPNVWPIDRNGDTIYIVICPIQAGQQLFVSNYSFHWNDPTKYYQRMSEIDCKCERCKGLRPPEAETLAFSSDPDFELIESCEIRSESDCIDSKRFDILKETCVKLLKKYGNMIWCTELGIVIVVYMHLLKAEMRGIVKSQDILNNNSG
ncbi:uncharacterized protein LOC129566545 [Sitodiplosis mosellana]|uniref:uncharacterized protein LOC129566545 n=1 Tax=Sitodiplosis mosellana TaxID=263140 RepID=UPI0024444018|nr:uncharacterized protein LOC129566545 [Sitodiplosis mosellana]